MDKGVRERLYGNYRAKVVNNKDKEKFGRVLVYIPDLMPTLDSRKDGIWARPANNPIGGRNTEGDNEDCYYAGSSYIPEKDSWVWIFFECGQINRPYYFGALDLENAKVLPENQTGGRPQNKWVILKSGSGRAIVVSDDGSRDGDERVEITGKKRLIKDPPSGDVSSVTKIDDNMTTILLDERDGKQKILMRTYKGDFLHIDIDEQNLQAYFKNDIKIQCDGDFFLTVDGDINIKSNAGDGKVEFKSGELDVKVSGDYKSGVGGSNNIKAQNSANLECLGTINRKAGGNINDDGAILNQQGGAATGAQSPSGAANADPKGERNT